MPELTQKRSYSSKVFDLENGQLQGHFHGGHIHYKDANGDIEVIRIKRVSG